MKRKKILLVPFFCLFCPLSIHAQIVSAGEALIASLLEKTGLADEIAYAQQLAQMVESVQNTYQQVQMMIEAEKRALQNLKSIVDVRSWDEFMKWNNRQLYMEQQVEERFNNLGVKIGKETYTLEEIEGIPDALNENFGDPYWDDFTEEERRDMYLGLGLAPSNYMYIQTWQEREKRIGKKILTMAGIIADENEDATNRNQELIEKYTRENPNLDINEILKDSGVTLANIEQVIREQNRLMAEQAEWELARARQEEISDSSFLPADWGNYWKPITTGSGRDEFID